MPDVAVVGATGQIGRELVRLLAVEGASIRALVRDPERASEALPPSADLVIGDLDDHDALTQLVAGARTLFVVSSDPAREPAALDAATRAGVQHVVKSSALGPGGDPPADHALAEAALKANPVAATILRPNAFMQTLRGYLPALVDDGTFALPAGDGATAWIDARDIAAVAAAVLLADPPAKARTITITGPQALTMADVAAFVARQTGTAMRYEPLEPAGADEDLSLRLGPMGRFLAIHYAAVAAGDFAEVTDAVPKLVGRSARSLAELVSENPQAWDRDVPLRRAQPQRHAADA